MSLGSTWRILKLAWLTPTYALDKVLATVADEWKTDW